ncbi:MAG TPA: hypothetical protein VL484_10775 [Vicinamibacterales bacterium]|jgi:hypothetical protein|nr:hypothetical protein [Vicinamibacterales bacterium]
MQQVRADYRLCYYRGMRARTVALLLAITAVAARPSDQLANARRLYNQGEYDQALVAAHEAESDPASVSSARLVIGRIRLERYRRTADGSDLSDARTALRSVDPAALDPRERTELQVGLAEILYLDNRFGAAAEMLEPILGGTSALGPDAHARALDWWATALDRQAQMVTPADRIPMYRRITDLMTDELRLDPASPVPNYWMAAAARGAGDLDRAMAAASAAWVRASLTHDRGAGLRADLDRLVTQAIIPERAAHATTRDKRQAIADMTAEWDSFKTAWNK